MNSFAHLLSSYSELHLKRYLEFAEETTAPAKRARLVKFLDQMRGLQPGTRTVLPAGAVDLNHLDAFIRGTNTLPQVVNVAGKERVMAQSTELAIQAIIDTDGRKLPILTSRMEDVAKGTGRLLTVEERGVTVVIHEQFLGVKEVEGTVNKIGSSTAGLSTEFMETSLARLGRASSADAAKNAAVVPNRFGQARAALKDTRSADVIVQDGVGVVEAVIKNNTLSKGAAGAEDVSNIETVLETLNDQKFYDPKKYPGFVAEAGKNVAQGDVKLAGKDYFLNHLKGDNTLGRPYELMIASTLDEPAQAGHYVQFGFKDKGIEVDLLEIRGNTKFLHEAKTSPADFQNTPDVQKLLLKLEKYCVDNKFTGGFYQCHGTPDPALLSWAKANLKSNLIVIQENIFFK